MPDGGSAAHAPRAQWAYRLTKCFSPRQWTTFIVLVSAALIVLFSVSLTLALQSITNGVLKPSGGAGAWEPLVSNMLGWAYFVAWSISFYPQVLQNWQRRSVVGLSFDYQVLNVLGFLCYFVFSLEFFSDPHVQEEYQDIHDGHRNVVAVQDLVFAAHALLFSSITVAQIFVCGYDKGKQRLAWWCIGFVILVVLLAIIYGGLCIVRDARADPPDNMFFTWVNFLYFLSIVKLVISAIKYVPQTVLNCKRKSTNGWNIWNVLLDFTGGSLSLAQLLMDAAHNHDWTAIMGDPVKFGLSILSIAFDIIFMVQHYCLFPEGRANKQAEDGEDVEAAPALGASGNKQLGEVLLE